MVTGLMSEVGEVAELIQKRIRGDKGYQDEGKFIEKLEKELGDILWHVASICNVYELDLNEVADINIAKLTSRKERNMIQGNGDDR
jgi:NTP pyrophosphatase (non-canonical NTP hydrolase)